MEGTGCGCALCALCALCVAAKCQTVCVSKMRLRIGEERKSTHIPLHKLFYVCCVGVSDSRDAPDWRLFDWQPNLSLFLSVDLFVLFLSVSIYFQSSRLKVSRSLLSSNFILFCPVDMHSESSTFIVFLQSIKTEVILNIL